MKLPTCAAVAALVLIPVAPIEAQEPDETRTALLESDSRDTGISADELEIFADIYVALEKTSAKYEMELAGVASEEEAQSLQAEMQRESQEQIEEHGWTQDKYERVSDAVNSSPLLLERALALIEERS